LLVFPEPVEGLLTIQLLIPTPFSRSLAVEVNDDTIVASSWASVRAATEMPKTKRGSLAAEVVRQVSAYAMKRLVVFDLPLDLSGTEFELAVWRAVMTIPFGISVSYSEVARAIDRPAAHRGVARAMASLQYALFVPAHRVVGADGKVKGAAANSMRTRLLAFEKRK
jgi:O-6-methylguanine DNA methyltransferase